ncbi:MAG TPA: HD domain-containing protein, partial [Niabella sp.]|nr:HD domain-containing protein [Niabella sp.]
MEILGKPSGISLEQHVKNVLAEGNYLMDSFPISFEKYERIIQKDLKKRLKGAIQYHDEGKKHIAWQNACQKDYREFLKWQAKHAGNFKTFSNAKRDVAGANLRQSGIRHEVYSLNLHINNNFSQPVKVAIAAHHSKLSRRHEHRWTDNSSGAFS